VSFQIAPGWAALFVVPAIVAAAVALDAKVRAAGPLLWWDLDVAARVLAATYGVIAMLSLLLSRSGVVLFELREPIVELTAVHYTFAGAAALVLAAHARRVARGTRLATAAVILTASAPPFVALGFVSGAALPQVGGAVLMTLGVWATASLQLREALSGSRGVVRVLLAISGLAIWVPMVLAVAWAAGQHWDIPALSIRDMARTHGLVNAFAFVLCGLTARSLVRRDAARRHDVLA
jgi:hypothetical protein